MATIHFTGTRYTSFDGTTPLSFTEPGHYQVSDEKAAQLAADFPHEFTQVLEGKADKAPASDQETGKAPESTHDEKPTKKGK